jgi:hypothetical protein
VFYVTLFPEIYGRFGTSMACFVCVWGITTNATMHVMANCNPLLCGCGHMADLCTTQCFHDLAHAILLLQRYEELLILM